MIDFLLGVLQTFLGSLLAFAVIIYFVIRNDTGKNEERNE